MLVISAKGIIYDVPEKDLKKHAVVRWINKKNEIAKMLSSLTKVITKSLAGLESEVEGEGCCNRFANWCPPGGAEN
jgi:hypothetical protein